jgi:hypothetical protein
MDGEVTGGERLGASFREAGTEPGLRPRADGRQDVFGSLFIEARKMNVLRLSDVGTRMGSLPGTFLAPERLGGLR